MMDRVGPPSPQHPLGLREAPEPERGHAAPTTRRLRAPWEGRAEAWTWHLRAWLLLYGIGLARTERLLRRAEAAASVDAQLGGRDAQPPTALLPAR